MKIKFIKRYYILCVFTIVFFSSCEEFVSVDVPETQLSGERVFEDVRTAEAVLVTLYSKMQSNVMVTGDTGGITVLLGHYTDELHCYNTNLPEYIFNQNQLLVNNGTVQGLWRTTYNLIYIANNVIEGIQKATTISTADRERLMGEALFVRAYLHFYLNQLFGEIPYVISTDYRINTIIGKCTNATLYGLIEADLLQAERLLTNNYTGQYRVRPNKSTVMALLARLYLYQGEWELAKQKASAVLDNTGIYQLTNDINAVFLRNSTGTIWQLMSAPEGKNTLEAKSFIFTTVPPPARALNQIFINQFETGDIRPVYWIKSVTNNLTTYYHPYKYKYNNDTSSSMEYSIQFRIEEMYLIRAEANAQLNYLDESRNDLNVIRNRAGLNNTLAMSKETILNAILKERQLEFFCEMGHRFFDLKRQGLLDALLTGVKPGWNSTDALFPLPENELLLNPNLLPQNIGY